MKGIIVIALLFAQLGCIKTAWTQSTPPPPPPPPPPIEEPTEDGNVNQKPSDPEMEVYMMVEEMPVYPGGQDAMTKDLAKNVTYPEDEKKAKKQGNVYVQFIVERDGSLSQIEVIRGVANAPGLSAAAINGVSKLKNFVPGKIKGEAVRVKMVVPVKFSL